MKIILSPAKKMNVDNDVLLPTGIPVFMQETEKILSSLQSMKEGQLQKLWKCNDEIARLNIDRLSGMDLHRNLTPAILSYEGIAYRYMAASVFEDQEYDYVQNHLRILSAFYGVLKPMDGVTPYRLEMQAKLSVGEYKDLYAFWGRKLYEEVRDESRIIINLASKEYSKCISKYLTKKDRFVTVSFVEEAKGKLVTKGTYAKMARGEMVRFMAEHRVEAPEELAGFDHLGYHFRRDISSPAEMVFQRL